VKRFLFRLFFFILLIIPCATVSAQNPYFISYDTEDGLPSSQIYEAYQDKDGYMWFTTDRGITRYDGYTFRTYTTENGLANLVNFKFFEDDNNFIWVNGYDGTLSYWDGNTFKAFKFNEKLKELAKTKTRWFQIINIESNKISFVFNLIEGLPEKHYTIDIRTGELKQEIFSENTKVSPKVSPHTLFKLNGSHKEDETLINQVIDNDENTWKLTNSGALFYQKDKIDDLPINYFSESIVSSVYQDIDQNYWLTTMNNGILYIPSLKIDRLDLGVDTDKSFDKLKIIENVLVAQKTEKKEYSFIYKDKFFVSEHSDQIKISEGLKNFNIKHELGNFTSHNLFNDRIKYKDETYLLFRRDFLAIEDYSENPHKKIFHFKTRALCAIDVNNDFIIGTDDGLLKLRKYNNDFKVEKIDIDNHGSSRIRVNDIEKGSNGIWMGSLNNGLFFFHNDSISDVETNKKLSQSKIECLYQQNDSVLWIGTKNGLFKLKYKNHNGLPVKSHIEHYTTSDGLHSNSINDIIFWNDNLMVSTNKGISFFDPNMKIKRSKKSRIAINNFYVNGKKSIDNRDVYDLKYNENNIKISYLGIFFDKKNENDYFYRYKLKDEGWKFTNDTILYFDFLPRGTYDFEIQCQNFDGKWSESKFLEFYIAPHFSELLIFRLTVLLILVLVATYIIKRRIQSSKEKLNTEILIKESELAVLRNQMNPHFVFNSLNSLQEKIFKGHKIEANQYIGDFSSLMRKSLELSNKSKILINAEIDFVKSYLSLEKRRFKDKFGYKVNLEDNHGPDPVYLAPLMIQPLVENAVKHAFKKLESREKGFIEVHYQIKKEFILVKIKDNGCGFLWNSSSNKNNKSLGLEIVNQRLELFNKKMKTNIYTLKFLNVNKGTSIEIKLPIL